jgi:hypothetical protein
VKPQPTSTASPLDLQAPNDNTGRLFVVEQEGYVYHGATIAALQNVYVFGDFVSGNIWGLQRQTNGSWTHTRLASTDKNISSLGQDQNGELYVVDYSGSVWKLAAP